MAKRKGGGQPNNQNAAKWTEEKAIELGTDLINWLSASEENVLFEYFLTVEKKLYRSSIEYLGRKYSSFSDLIKIARSIQKNKLINGGLKHGLNVGMAIFTLRTHHGMNEDKEDSYDFEKNSTDNLLPLTKAQEATRLYIQNYHHIIKQRIIINRGGTRSTKTYSICQIAIDWLLSGNLNGAYDIKKFDIARGWSTTVKSTVLKDIEEIIDNKNANDKIKHHKTKGEFTYQGRTLSYYGLDDEQKIRGRKRDIILIDEANEISHETFKQLEFRTKYSLILCFNPSEEDIWINTELEQKHNQDRAKQGKKPNLIVLISSYLDNPFLSEAQIETIEELREKDPEYYQIFGLGNYGSITGQVYEHGTNWDTFRTLPKESFNELQAMDFGFSPDPTAWGHLYFSKKERIVYVYPIVYERELLSSDLAAIGRQSEFNYEREVVCDHDKRLISDLRNEGFDAIQAYKGKDSVISGISVVKKYKVMIHESFVDMIREIKLYKRPKNKQTGEYDIKPLKMNDHTMDMLRYGITYYDRNEGHIYLKE